MSAILEKFKSLAAMKVEAGPFTAVDFDRGRMRLVHAEHRGATTKIRKIESVQVPAEVDLANPEAVGVFLGGVLRKSSFRGRGLVMSVPRSQAILKPMTLPPANDISELAGMVLYQVEKDLPFKVEEAAIDYTPSSHYDVEGGAEAGGTSVLAAVVRMPVVDHYKRTAAAAKTKLLRLSFRPYANAYCIRAWKSAGGSLPSCAALVDINPDELELDVLVDGGLAFTRSTPVRLAPRLDAAAPPAPANATPAPPAPDAVESLVNEIARSLRSYQSLHAERRIDVVLVAGAAGIESRVADELSQRIGIECKLFNPIDALGVSERGANGSEFVAALGLALGHRRADLPFDFLKPARSAPPVDRNKQRRRTYALAGAALATAVIAGGFMSLRMKQARYDDLSRRYATLQTENKRVLALEKRFAAIDKWLKDGVAWLDQWAMLSATFPGAPDAYITGLQANPDGSMSFTVRARTSDVITDVGKRLQTAGYDFKPGTASTREDPQGYNFTADARVKITPKVKIDPASLIATTRPADDVSNDPNQRAPEQQMKNARPWRQRNRQPQNQGQNQGQGR